MCFGGPASGPGAGEPDLSPGCATGEVRIRFAQPLQGLDVVLDLLGPRCEGIGLEGWELGETGHLPATLQRQPLLRWAGNDSESRAWRSRSGAGVRREAVSGSRVCREAENPLIGDHDPLCHRLGREPARPLATGHTRIR